TFRGSGFWPKVIFSARAWPETVKRIPPIRAAINALAVTDCPPTFLLGPPSLTPLADVGIFVRRSGPNLDTRRSAGFLQLDADPTITMTVFATTWQSVASSP